MATTPLQNVPSSPWWGRLIPNWLLTYQRQDLPGDIIAGVVVAIMLVPQSMAYALLAGLPPQTGLYASILPLVIYGLMGSSRTLAVGPVAIVSLLVATGLARVTSDPSEYLAYALLLALMVGVIQVVMGVLRVGFLVNFLSHPVLAGFTSAAALVIAFSQLKVVLGFAIPRAEHPYEMALYALEHLHKTHLPSLVMAAFGFGILWVFKYRVAGWLSRWKVPQTYHIPITRSAPLLLVMLGVGLTWAFGLHESAQIAIVGDVPGGLPSPSLPSLELSAINDLLPIALTISVIGFMESFSIAKVMASKKRQKIDANQELIALGSANLGAAFTGGYPVTGGLSRSMVNFSAGANSGLASMITAGLIVISLLVLTPVFAYLPDVALASIILISVVGLFDFKTMRHTWQYNKADGISLLATFLGVMLLGIETGILIGVASSLGLYLWRTSRPHIAIVGRVPNSEHYRNIRNYDVETCDKVLAVRVDESLYFANAQYLESYLLATIAERPQVEHLVLVCSAVNEVDTSALDVLENLIEELHDSGVQLHLAEVKQPVYKRLATIGFVDTLGKQHIFLSTHAAMQALNIPC